MDWSVFLDALPALASVLAVPLVAVVKTAARSVSSEIPRDLKAPLAIVIGALIASFTGISPDVVSPAIVPVLGGGVAAGAVVLRDIADRNR